MAEFFKLSASTERRYILFAWRRNRNGWQGPCDLPYRHCAHTSASGSHWRPQINSGSVQRTGLALSTRVQISSSGRDTRKRRPSRLGSTSGQRCMAYFCTRNSSHLAQGRPNASATTRICAKWDYPAHSAHSRTYRRLHFTDH